jgi:hypothetical protein
MSLALVQITLRIGYAWIWFNLASIALLATMYSFHQATVTIQRRRLMKTGHLAAVVCIARR